MHRLINLLVAISLVLSSIAPASLASATPLPPARSDEFIRPFQTPASAPGSDEFIRPPAAYAAYLAPADAQPLLRDTPHYLPTVYGIDAEQQQAAGPYRTTVQIRGVADLARLKALGATLLTASAANATLIVDRTQLEQVAKLNFYPRNTELTARLVAKSGSPLPQLATAVDVLAATALDSDGDGLNDTEEGWWCTDPANADSDNDKVNDGAEAQALADWLQHKTLTRPASGKPFAGWPPDHAGCYDSDYDSVPDAVEVYVFGLNPNRESTDGDKFDDGQELFGITSCPGSGTACGYGLLPRSADLSWGYITNNMPSWVTAPGSDPLVAAYPVVQVDPVIGTGFVTLKQITSTERIVTQGEQKAVGTAKTTGKSTTTGTIDTNSIRQWQETSDSNGGLGASPSTSSETHGNVAVDNRLDPRILLRSSGTATQSPQSSQAIDEVLVPEAPSESCPPATTNAVYYLPWEAGKTYSLTNGPFQPPSTNTHASSWAWDFNMKYQEVHAARTGTVLKIQSTDAGGFGKYILVNHGDGTAALYAHLDQIRIKEKDPQGKPFPIARGDVIAISGDTGNTSPPGNGQHLHFQVQPSTLSVGVSNPTCEIRFQDSGFPNGSNPLAPSYAYKAVTSTNNVQRVTPTSPPAKAAIQPNCNGLLNGISCAFWNSSLGKYIQTIQGKNPVRLASGHHRVLRQVAAS